MKRFLFVLSILTFSAMSFASEEWISIYLQGRKIGYSHSETLDKGWENSAGSHTVSYSLIKAEVLGQFLEIESKSTMWMDSQGTVQHINYRMESGGRVSDVDVVVKGDQLFVTSLMAGNETKKILKLPKGKRMVNDPMTDFLGSGTLDKEVEFVTFDPNFLALYDGTVRYIGREKTKIGDFVVDAHKLVIDDPRSKMNVYMSSKGDLIKATGPLGMELYPDTKEGAVNLESGQVDGIVPDIAFSTSTRPDKEIKESRTTTELELLVTRTDISHIPNDGHQTIRKQVGGWILNVHPIAPDYDNAVSIKQAARAQPDWTRPESRIESDLKLFKDHAQLVVGDETNVLRAAEKIRSYVYSIVKANAGIGLIRDASEILATKEGVCRDHAILSATIMRAAGLPTRMVSGMVYAQGQFFYHAWVEVYDGKSWVGFDSTRPESRLSATHIKTGQGTIKQAYTSFLLDGVKFQVLMVKNKGASE